MSVQERPVPSASWTRGTIALGVLALGSLVVLAVLGLDVAPTDRVQGDAQRLMYVHVPAAWLAFLAFGVTTLASALWLWPRTRHQKWDRVAASSAELGVVFTALTLVLGMLWGRPGWGVYWTWDAPLVTTAVLFFLNLGYLALRRVADEPDVKARRSAIAALVAFVDVPLVHFSVEWWRTLHQKGTVLNRDLDPQIHGDMGLTLLWGVVAFTLVYVVLLLRRIRVTELEERIEMSQLELAIAERRSEAVTAGVTSGE